MTLDLSALEGYGRQELQLKAYRQHRCSAKHRTFNVMARCMFPYAHWVSGEGPIALISRCRGVSVSLWSSVDAAMPSKNMIDDSGCGGACGGRHEIVRLVLP